jgi:hypothetical protein
VIEALGGGQPPLTTDHHLGRPYLTAYQLAIEVEASHPEIATTLGVTIGGKGTGAATSLAQYLARELSRNIRRDGQQYPIEGARLSDDHLTTLIYRTAEGAPLTSSLAGSGIACSMFRLRS